MLIRRHFVSHLELEVRVNVYIRLNQVGLDEIRLANGWHCRIAQPDRDDGLILISRLIKKEIEMKKHVVQYR